MKVLIVEKSLSIYWRFQHNQFANKVTPLPFDFYCNGIRFVLQRQDTFKSTLQIPTITRGTTVYTSEKCIGVGVPGFITVDARSLVLPSRHYLFCRLRIRITENFCQGRRYSGKVNMVEPVSSQCTGVDKRSFQSNKVQRSTVDFYQLFPRK